MKRRVAMTASLVAVLLAWAVSAPLGLTADISQERVVKYLLATVIAFRTVYSKDIVEKAKRGGVKAVEDWKNNAHAIMLPPQLVGAAGAEIKDYELALIGLTPIYRSNLPKTQAETEALKKMAANPDQRILTFVDGNQFKGLAGDFAVSQGCVDCHNSHPSSPKKDFKKGDLMGATVVRLNK